MTIRVGTSGTVEYTGRAFNQDAQEAMGGDIVRALIELITNSDDAYAAAGNAAAGKIVVEIDRGRGREWTAAVKDRATGMSVQEQVHKIARLGGRTSGFEAGEARRGNLGRGAKDVAAFGEVTFESVKDNRYAGFRLRHDGTYLVEADERVGDNHRARLGIPRGSGTVVTIHVQPGVRCPRQQTLKQKLSSHFQLRDILSDPARRVELVVNGHRELLTYTYPELPVVFDGPLSIDGYAKANARLLIWRHPVRYDEGRDDPTRAPGILIKGARAIYDNTLFRFEGNPHAGWFAGALVCEYIDQLARTYDDTLGEGQHVDPSNPAPIISRRRDGLAPHPFTQALRTAVEGPLGHLVAEEAERAQREGSRLEDAQSRAALDRLGREISRFIGDELREIEAEEEGESPEGTVPPIAIIPEMAYAYLGEDRTLSVHVRSDIADPGDTVAVSTDPLGIVEPLNVEPSLAPHPRRPDLLIGQIRLHPLVENDSAMLTASINEHSTDALVEVRPSRPIVEEPVEPPETLEFDRSSYRVGLQREKTLLLRAPSPLVASQGRSANVSSSAPGVVVRTPTVELALDEDLDYWVGRVRIDGRGLGATASINATLGDVAASALVNVVRREEGPSFRIEVSDEDMGHWRAILSATPDPATQDRVIKVNGRHRALRDLMDQQTLSSRDARLVVAEAVSDAAVRHIVNQLYRRRRDSEEFTSERLYLEHSRRVSRLLPRAQAVLLADLESSSGVLIDTRAS